MRQTTKIGLSDVRYLPKPLTQPLVDIHCLCLPGWANKVLNALLRKLKAVSYTRAETPSYSEVVINRDRIIEAIMRSRISPEALIGRRAKYVICGPEELGVIKNALHAEFRTSIPYIGPGGYIEFYGLTVLCYPWVRGLTVIPEPQTQQ